MKFVPPRLASMPGMPDDAALLSELADANGFDLAALPDNRAGRLTLAVGAGFIGWVAPRFATFRHDVSAGVVTSVDGVVHAVRDVRNAQAMVVNGPSGPAHYYQLGEQYFEVGAAGYNTLVDGRRYRIYYLPDATTRRAQALSPMVNIEPLPEPDGT